MKNKKCGVAWFGNSRATGAASRKSHTGEPKKDLHVRAAVAYCELSEAVKIYTMNIRSDGNPGQSAKEVLA